jgi:murein DD-endopeptidase MepM/ murein hydrolase activator NlpD
MQKVWILAGIVLLAVACTDEKIPTAPTPVAGPTPPLVPPPLPTNVPGVLALSMPIDAADSANTVFGMTPFGYHAGDLHAQDGHSGWDVEFRAGGVVRAAAAGTIEEVFTDTLGRFTVQVGHLVGGHFYRTIYSNLATISPDIELEKSVTAGQAIGTPGVIIGNAGTFIHFQLDDLEFHREIANPKAVSPEPFLTPAAKSVFDTIWQRAEFGHELVEPFATNPRALSFPASRTWTRAGGDGPAGIRFTRYNERDVAYNYEILAESGTVIESGTVAIDPTSRPNPLIALTAATGVRLGIYDVVSNEMRLSLGSPGSPRPAGLSGATIYRTAQ